MNNMCERTGVSEMSEMRELEVARLAEPENCTLLKCVGGDRYAIWSWATNGLTTKYPDEWSLEDCEMYLRNRKQHRMESERRADATRTFTDGES